MKYRLFFALSILTIQAVASWHVNRSSASPQNSANVESEVREAIRQRLDALRRGDAKSYVAFFADDCIITGDTGALIKPEDITKEWADDRHSGITFTGGEPIDVQVHAYGEIAVASFRTELDQDWAGQKLFEVSRFTDVFAHRGGRWLLVAHDETPIPNARRLAAKVNPKVFDAYAGDYQLMPNYVIKVKREGDKLMELWPGDAGYGEDVPVSDSTFVARGELGEEIYVKDETGKVSQLIIRTGLGDLIAKKIR